MVAELIADHRALEGMVAQLRTTVAADLLDRFCDLLTGHIRREENELFQEVQRTLSREEVDSTGDEIGRRV
jgi:hemerythrin-like domain-containing protein